MNCENARQYYYDYLKKADMVPSDVKGHLEHCPACQKEMDCLREVLGQTHSVEKPYRPKYLQLHYQLLDQWISCDKVRPFLPSLLVPQFAVKQQTPVTAHVENCPECQTALKEIASLGLTSSECVKAARYLAGEQQEAALDKQTCAILNKVKNSPASDVWTQMRLKQTDDIERQWVSDSAIVDVEHRRTIKTVPQHRVSSRHAVSAWVTGGIAAAIVLAVLLVLPAGDIKALDVTQLYANLETVRNVHIQKFGGTEGT